MANAFEEALAGIGAALVTEAGRAIEDVREKVVEEGWFGRTVTEGPPEAAPEIGIAPPAPEEAPPQEIACLFDHELDTIISAPPDPDLQPHGQCIDR